MPHKHIYSNPRIEAEHLTQGDALTGQVVFDWPTFFWLAPMLLIGVVGGALTFSLSAFLVFAIFTGVSLCLGHSLGMHRRFIHRSYHCPRWLELCFLHLGTIVGLAGPLGLLKTHDLRDWAQRQPRCHPYLSHDEVWYKDAYWQLFCRLELEQAPECEPESGIQNDRVVRWMDSTWRWQQLPWALLLFAVGGLPWVIWGVCLRVSVGVLGHWLIGYMAHNVGHKSWNVEGAAVQGHNIKWASLLTMGECWHNNHHAFPYSAKLGLLPGQWDPGWWVLRLLEKIGLVSDLVVPDAAEQRSELRRLPALH